MKWNFLVKTGWINLLRVFLYQCCFPRRHFTANMRVAGHLLFNVLEVLMVSLIQGTCWKQLITAVKSGVPWNGSICMLLKSVSWNCYRQLTNLVNRTSQNIDSCDVTPLHIVLRRWTFYLWRTNQQRHTCVKVGTRICFSSMLFVIRPILFSIVLIYWRYREDYELWRLLYCRKTWVILTWCR